MNKQDLKELVASRLDEMELLDVLGLTIHDLVELLEEQIVENETELLRACE